jgi:formate dehydrogenase maturation protein FdhE
VSNLPVDLACVDLWDGRIRRARALAADHPSTGELLRFYAGLAERQRLLAREAVARQADSSIGPDDFSGAVALDVAAAAVPGFLGWVESAAPTPLARAARDACDAVDDWPRRLRDALSREDSSESDSARDAAASAVIFATGALLQPLAEVVARTRVGRQSRQSAPAPSVRRAAKGRSRCPVCAGRPVLGVLREDGHGARRSLVCWRCLTTWDFLRVTCAGCEEQQFDALPVFTADAFPQVRVEACECCHRYLKTIDLTKDGLAVPIVDDVASISLDLWAQQQGYRRLQNGLLT